MGNPSPASHEPQAASSSDCPTTAESDERSPPYTSNVMRFLEGVGISNPIPENYSSEDFYSDLLCNHLKVDTVRRGHVTCFTTVKPTITVILSDVSPFNRTYYMNFSFTLSGEGVVLQNFFGGLHGGAVAAIAERVATATARTVVGEDKDMFLGELAMSYLSSATIDAELIVEGSVIRSGRNLTVIVVEFRRRKTGKLVYYSRATLYNSPLIAKL